MRDSDRQTQTRHANTQTRKYANFDRTFRFVGAAQHARELAHRNDERSICSRIEQTASENQHSSAANANYTAEFANAIKQRASGDSMIQRFSNSEESKIEAFPQQNEFTALAVPAINHSRFVAHNCQQDNNLPLRCSPNMSVWLSEL